MRNVEIGIRNSVEFGAWSVELRTKVNLWCAAVAASAPSEEGAGAPKGFRGATEGERTRGGAGAIGVGVH